MCSDRIRYWTLPETNLVLKPNETNDFLEDINRSFNWLDGFENETGYVEGFTIKENRLWRNGYCFFNDQIVTWPDMPQPTKWTTDDLISCNTEQETTSTKGWGDIEPIEEKPKPAKKKKRKKKAKPKRQDEMELGE